MLILMSDCSPGILFLFWLWYPYWSVRDISMLDLYISLSFSHTPTLSVWWASVVLEGRYPFHTTTQSIPPGKEGDERGKDGWSKGKGRAGEGDDSSSVRGAVHQCLNPQTCIYSEHTILTDEPRGKMIIERWEGSGQICPRYLNCED